MGILDRGKVVGRQARVRAKQSVTRGQTKLREARVTRDFNALLRELGAVSYAEHRGEGDHAAVVRALEDLDAYRKAHPEVDSTQEGSEE